MDDAAFERLSATHYEELRSDALALVRWWRERLAPEVTVTDSAGGPDGGPLLDPQLEEALGRVFGDLEIVAEVWARRVTDGADRARERSFRVSASGARPAAPAGLLPDDPDLYALLDRVERRLIRPLAATARDSSLADCMPAPLSDSRSVLAAYRQVRGAIPPPGDSLPITAANGRWTLVGLHVLDLPEGAVRVLQTALMELSAALASPPLEHPQDATRRILLRLAARVGATPDALVGDLARILALLDMPADRATLELRSLVTARPCDGVRLDHRQAELYRAFAQRTIPLVLDFDRVTPSLFDDPDPGS